MNDGAIQENALVFSDFGTYSEKSNHKETNKEHEENSLIIQPVSLNKSVEDSECKKRKPNQQQVGIASSSIDSSSIYNGSDPNIDELYGKQL